MKKGNLLQFDTLKEKPKIRNIAWLTAAFVVSYTLMVVLGVNPRLIMFFLLAYLFAVFVMLIMAFIKQLRYNPYSYNTIYYTGFALFDLSVIISQCYLIRMLGENTLQEEHLLMNMFFFLVDSAQTFMIYSLPFILIFSAALLYSNFMLIRKEGAKFVNYLGMILAVLMVGGEAYLIFGNMYYSGSHLAVMLRSIFVNVFSAVYLYYECMIIGTIVANLCVISYEPERNQDFIIILGCGLMADGTVTPLLKGRADKAIEFYRQQIEENGKAAILIPSGGQGNDEIISEAQSVKNYLLTQGIPEENIILEDKSHDTYENMLFSRNIIESIKKDANVIFATTKYHIFRSGLKARQVKMKATGIGAHTTWYFWPNATVREFVGILTEHRGKQALILGSMIIIYTLGTVLAYMI